MAQGVALSTDDSGSAGFATCRRDFALSSAYAGAAGETERQLLALWQATLDVEGLGVLDDFFELGGDSFMAVRLFTAIEEAFGASLPVSILLECPTVRLLARRFEGQQAAQTPCPLVSIRRNGARTPLYVVHAATGNVLFARQLLPYLDKEQALYGIQARGLSAGEVPHDRFESMAEDYLAAIRAAQPQGPYFLVGYCIGGLIALEIARMLRAAGEEIRFLGMIDPSLHPCVAPWLSWRKPDALSARLRRQIARIAWHVKRRRRGVVRQAIAGLMPTRAEVNLENQERQLAVHAGARAALKAYRPAPYDGTVTIFFSAEHRADFAANRDRGTALATRVDIVDLGVSHDDVFTTEIGALGRALQNRIDLLAV